MTLFVGGTILQVMQAAKLLPTIIPMSAVNDNPAVSAFGYDCLLGIVSIGLYSMV
jgi:hypothetical protein